MDTNVQALKNLYEQLGGDPADVADISTNAGMINAIAELDIGGGGGGGGTVDQTYNATSTNAQSGTAVAEALSSAKYTVTFPQSPVATVVASQSFTNPYGNEGYIYTLAFHARQTAPSTLPDGAYIGISTSYGLVGFSVSSGMLYCHAVVTDYGTDNKTVGSTTTLSTFTNMPSYKIG